MIATRRRGYLQEDDSVTMIHPDWYMADVKTTSNNQSIKFWAGQSNIQRVIIDDVEYPAEQGVFTTGGDTITVPTAGDHIIYFKTGYVGGYSTIFSGTRVFRLPRTVQGGSSHMHWSNASNLVIICLSKTPCGCNPNLLDSRTREVQVPIGCSDAYKAASGWSRFANKIVEVKYKFIEDE